MAKIIEKIVQQSTAPNSVNVLWDDGEGLKIFRNGKWKYIINYDIDTTMSDTSANAVQNKTIKDYVDGLVGNINTILDSINGEEI